MTDRIVDLENNLAISVNDQPAQRAALEGLGIGADLAAGEAASWRRFIPGNARLPWTELQGFEEEIAKLEQRRRENEQQRLEVTEQLRAAPQSDKEVLSQWQRDGQPGARPEPSAPNLEAELKRLEQDELALLGAIDSVTNERVTFVAKNRAKLVKDAAEAEDKARERALRALDELEQAREGLVEARRVRLWSELYPAQETMREPVWAWLAGGMKRVVASLGITVQAPAAETVFAALREDVDWVATAMSRDQQLKLGGPARATFEDRDRQIEDLDVLRRGARADESAALADGLKRRGDELGRMGRRI